MAKETKFIDTHAHLAMLEESPESDIIKRAKDANLSHIITVSTNETSWEPNRRLATTHPSIYYSLGVHPHEAIHWAIWGTNLFQRFEPFPNNPEKCVAIGETGLDFHYDLSPRDFQIQAFESQLEFAKKVNLPVIIHCRDAFDTVYDSIKRIGLGPRAGVMHCYTGGKEELGPALDLGLKISLSGILTFPKAETLRQAAQLVPLKDLFIETDCPFLAPIPLRGKPNEPSYLPHTAQCLADTLGKSFEEIADVTTHNAIEFFKLPNT